MNKTYIVMITVMLALNTGCVNCVNQSVHGDGKAVVVKSTSSNKAVAPVKKSTSTTSSDWILVSTTKEIISSQPVLF